MARRVAIPTSVVCIESGAFDGCARLEEVVFDGNCAIEAVAERCFYGTGLRKVVLPASVKRLEARAFYGCAWLETVSLPRELKDIGEECFCQAGLRELKLQASVREISEGAFYLCTRLRSVVIPNESKLSRVGPRAFGGTPLGPGDVRFPERLYVDDWAFAGPQM